MLEDTPTPSGPTSPTSELPQPKTDFRIGEEFGTAKKNLPPVKILVIGAGIILVAWAIAAFLQRPRTSASGSIDEVVSVDIPGQNSVMVAINVSFQNGGTKPFWIHTIKSELQTASGSFTDEAASPVDFERYFQAFPALKQYAIAPLKVEAKIEPGAEIKGTIVVSFPVTPDAFAGRKLLNVIIQPYDQPVPLVLSK